MPKKESKFRLTIVAVRFIVLTFGLFVSKRPVERPMRSASPCLWERSGETEREREAIEEESSNED